MRVTSFDEFVALSERGTFVPVCREIMADMLTPVSAFLKVAEHAEQAFLLESVEGGEHVARYSFLGKDPFLVLRSQNGRTFVQGVTTTETDEPFLDVLRRLTSRFEAPQVPGLPRFIGGAVGYLGYETAAWFEPTVPRLPVEGEAPPDAVFMLFDTILAFDHVRHRILAIANACVSPGADLAELYRFACARAEFLERELSREISRTEPHSTSHVETGRSARREDFEHAVLQAKEHIAAGDIYQVVLSQRFDAGTAPEPFRVYRALRHVSPAPYMFFLRMDRLAVAGASPEMLVRVEGRRVETHPIAGTRPRGTTGDEDLRLAAELQASEKERAEHVMLVDLGRNDIGRVSEYGSVRVPQFMQLERYSHVMHLVSVVEGCLAHDRDRLDALVSCFPAGTVSGAPKLRAMQIIAALEPAARGIYAGAVGYIDFAGNLDFCIAIRTVVMQGGQAYVQAGAGIVADSEPAAEYDETCHKAGALLEAIRMAAASGW
jgi:anthranilate synthase component I